MTKSSAARVAKRMRDRQLDEPVTLKSGVLVKLTPVSMSIITEAQVLIEDPAPPVWYNESKNREEVNPNDPEYLKALRKADEDRNLAAMDAIVMFGVELVNGVPDISEDPWLDMLKMREKRKLAPPILQEFDLNDPIDLEYLYKKYVAVTTADLPKIMAVSGVSEEDISTEMKKFQDNEK